MEYIISEFLRTLLAYIKILIIIVSDENIFKMTMILTKKNGLLYFTEMLSNHVFVLQNTFQQITLQ